MKLRNKILLLAAVPLVLALASTVLAVRYQTLAHAQREKAAVESAWLSSKRSEVSNYVQLARSAIEPWLDDDTIPVELAQGRALDLLHRMDFGADGYFFVYDLQGRNLMHPRQPELVGQDLSALRDRDGRPVIRTLLDAAQAGGDTGSSVRYLWHKPSSQRMVEKLGHVMTIARWEWMIGSGLYLDDIDQALARIDATAQTSLDSLYESVVVIASLALVTVAGCGLALNLSDLRQSDAKLARMAQQLVHSQEEERRRLSRELHDGVSQQMISIKLLIEAVSALPPANAKSALGKALAQIDATVKDVRQLSHRLRPALLDDLGLASALDHLVAELQVSGLPLADGPGDEADGRRTTPTIRFESTGEPRHVDATTATALFRIAQEALTNALRHANARQIVVGLDYGPRQLTLRISDDGHGFDLPTIQRDPDAGIGLRNMHERVAALAGWLRIDTHPGGTRVVAIVPAHVTVPSPAPSATS